MKYPKGITRCPRPKMINVRGRTWDQCTVTLPNGEKTKGFYDTTWGQNFYFQGPDGNWRRGDIYAYDAASGLAMIIAPDLRREPAPKDR